MRYLQCLQLLAVEYSALYVIVVGCIVMHDDFELFTLALFGIETQRDFIENRRRDVVGRR